MFTKYKKTDPYFKTNAQTQCGCPLKTHASTTGEPRLCTAIPTFHLVDENRWTCGRHTKKQEVVIEEECSVCLCDISKKQTHKLPCGHVFHKTCMKKWTTRGNNTCPLCRAVYPVPQPLRAPELELPQEFRWAMDVLSASFGPNPQLDLTESLLSINTVFAPHFQLVLDGEGFTIVTVMD